MLGEAQEMVLAVDVASGTILGTALLNPPEGTAAGHGATDDCAHLGFVAVDPSHVRHSDTSCTLHFDQCTIRLDTV